MKEPVQRFGEWQPHLRRSSGEGSAGACQPYHALVTTPAGPVPIGRIVEQHLLDLEVYDRHETTRVVAVKVSGTKPVLRCVLRNGNSVEATADHWVLAETSELGGSRLEWLEVGKLKPGMRLVQRTDTLVRANGECDPATASEAILAGWLQGDGYAGFTDARLGGTPLVEFMTADDEEFEYLRPHLARVFEGVSHEVRTVDAESEEMPLRRIRLRGDALVPFIVKYGLSERGIDRRVPEAIMRGGLVPATAYLRALFQTDGHMREAATPLDASEIELTSDSEDLVRDAQKLLGNLGLYSRTALQRGGRERREDRVPRWSLSLGGWHERERFRELIGFVSAAKQERLDASLASTPRAPSPNPIRYESITRIEYSGDQAVFDIQTQSGNYLSGNVVVHNCTLIPRR